MHVVLGVEIGRLRVTITFGTMKTVMGKMKNISKGKKWILRILF